MVPEKFDELYQLIDELLFLLRISRCRTSNCETTLEIDCIGKCKEVQNCFCIGNFETFLVNFAKNSNLCLI